EKGEDGELLSDEIRTKKWGKIIRTMNIDELTQILNILAFQMSFIGPRPLLLKEMCVMTEEQQELRQSVFPGISGWEAVNEEKTSTRTEMAEYDLFYVEHWSLWFDIKIFFKTIFIVFLKLRPDDSLRAPKMPEEISQEVPEEVGKR
ncbi:MAG: sugar transferase, partial [Oscillospiraceae bacterium]